MSMEELTNAILIRKILLMRIKGYEPKDIGDYFAINCTLVTSLCAKYKVVVCDHRSLDKILQMADSPFQSKKEEKFYVLEEVNQGKSYKEYLEDEVQRQRESLK